MMLSRLKGIAVLAGLTAIVLPPCVVAESMPPADDGRRVSGAGEPQAAALTLERAVAVALAGNPGLARVNARAQALAEVPSQAGTLPDPTLSLGALNVPTDTMSFSREAMTQKQVGISFALPFPGTLSLREQKAGYEARAAEFDVEEMRLVLMKNVRLAWWNLFFLDRALSTVQHNQKLLREFIKIAESKYKTGQGMQSDVLLAHVELSKLLEIEITLKASRRGQAAALNALLGLPASNPVMLPDSVDESLPPAPDIEPLRALAMETRPLLSAQRVALEATRTQVRLAEKEYYPDFRVGAAYGFRDGNNPDGSARADLASITLSMNLPIFSGSKQDRSVAQRKAEAMREEYGLQDRVAQVDTEIAQALSDYLAGYEQTSLFRTGIIPQASQTSSSMLAAYQVNKVDFLNLIRAQVTLYNYETQYWKALSSSWQAWARLEAAVGQPLMQAGQNDTAANADKEKGHEHK